MQLTLMYICKTSVIGGQYVIVIQKITSVPIHRYGENLFLHQHTDT